MRMSDMNEEQLKEALEHDRARKGNGEQTFRAETHDGEVVDVAPNVLLADLDVQQAVIVKGLAITFTEVARVCAAQVFLEMKRDDDVDIGELLNASEHALKLADFCGVLGDKAKGRLSE